MLPCLDGQHTFHAVGYAPSSYEGRVSSPIVEFNPEKMEARTRSRIYALKGDPATGQQNGDTTYTWTRWLNVNKVKSTDIEEVTLSYARKDM